MTIEQTAVVDAMGVDSKTGKLHLTIFDHLPWDHDFEDEHLCLLQEKLNSYLAFWENGEFLEAMPDAEGRSVCFTIVGRFELSERAENYIDYATRTMSEAGYELVFRQSSLSSDLH